MNREQMIEKAALILPYHVRLDPPGGACSCGHETALGRSCSEHVAIAVIDAILPQVTTVEELEALHRAKVTDSTNRLWTVDRIYVTSTGSSPVFTHAEALAELGPLTVVWQP